MIDTIYFRNYKIFKNEQELKLKPLTILIGKNSSGKSAITKLMTMIEGALDGGLNMPLSWENDGVELGAEFRDLVYGRDATRELEFGMKAGENTLNVSIASGIGVSDIPKVVSWKLNSKIELKYTGVNETYTSNKNSGKYECSFDGFNLNSYLGFFKNDDFSLELKGFTLPTNYIGPYRATPNRILENPFKYVHSVLIPLGADGGKSYSFLIWDALHNKSRILNLLSDWYKQKFEGWGLRVNIESPPNYKLELYRDNPRLSVNFKDVGQGMIQALPLVLSSYLPFEQDNILNVFEQPELHLHPAAHGNLAERFAKSTLNSNKRYLIETHSQNFVLRLRRLVAEGTLDKDDLMIYYVNYDEEKGESNLEPINVDENGSVDYWPSNVFSETLDETIAIRTAQMKNPYHVD